jgi:hypothetical protein
MTRHVGTFLAYSDGSIHLSVSPLETDARASDASPGSVFDQHGTIRCIPWQSNPFARAITPVSCCEATWALRPQDVMMSPSS